MLVLSSTGVRVTMTRVAGACHWTVRHGLSATGADDERAAGDGGPVRDQQDGGAVGQHAGLAGTEAHRAPCGQVAWVAEVSR